MKIQEEQEKRELFKKLLIELSKSQEYLMEKKDRAEVYRKLEKIYYSCDKDNFRHFYSDIFSILTLIDSDSSIGSLDILAQNIQAIRDGYMPVNEDEKHKNIDIHKEITKLYDHTNLDIARINYTKSITNTTDSKLREFQYITAELKQKIKDEEAILEQIKKDTENSEKKQQEMQKQYITILGIFASTVIAFTSGMVFSSSVLSNIDKASCYKLGVISLLIGIVFFNLIWILMDFIRSINGHLKRKLSYWIVINTILIIGIICIVICYFNQWF